MVFAQTLIHLDCLEIEGGRNLQTLSKGFLGVSVSKRHEPKGHPDHLIVLPDPTRSSVFEYLCILLSPVVAPAFERGLINSGACDRPNESTSDI